MKELKANHNNFDNQVEMLLSAYESFFIGKEGNYISTPITTGKRFIDLLIKHSAHDRHGLIAKFGDEVAKEMLDKVEAENIQSGEELSNSLRASNLTNVINPAKFRAIHFEQDHFNHFWSILIEKKIRSVYFNNNWEFSYGCRTEYVAAVRHKIPSYDAEKKPLTPSMGITKLNEAMTFLISNGFPDSMVSSLNSHLIQLQEISQSHNQQ